jgi:hypothetical protein
MPEATTTTMRDALWGIARAGMVCTACGMRTVFGVNHPWGSSCPYSVAMGIAVRRVWHNGAKAKAVVRRAGASMNVNLVTESVASYAVWLAQDSAEEVPNLRFLEAAIDDGNITNMLS